LPLSEKIRIEIFVPDLPNPLYGRMLEQFGDELTYAFGGCTVTPSTGKYRSPSGLILPDKINILFTDAPLEWKKDSAVIETYAEELQDVIQQALRNEESILLAVHPIFHVIHH
jgi:hypothetical protein